MSNDTILNYQSFNVDASAADSNPNTAGLCICNAFQPMLIRVARLMEMMEQWIGLTATLKRTKPSRRRSTFQCLLHPSKPSLMLD